jgi:radical SAM superfamily enzyme YgiQ (UPF0313 family)
MKGPDINVLLLEVYPYKDSFERVDEYTPEGLLAIAAYCTKHKPNTHFQIINRIDDPLLDYYSLVKPDIVGLSSTKNAKECIELSNYLKKVFPEAIFVIGGYIVDNHLSEGIPEGTLESERFDFFKVSPIEAACYGEGEIPFLNLLTHYEKGDYKDYLIQSKSWIVPNHKKSIVEERLENFDEIPPFDLSILFTKDTFNEISIQASRGCTNKCSFCSIRTSGKPVRRKSLDYLFETFLYYYYTFNVKGIVITDDSTFDDIPYYESILTFFEEHPFIKLINFDYYYIEHLQKHHIKRLKGLIPSFSIAIFSMDASCERLFYKAKGMKIKYEKYKEVISWCREYNFPCAITIVSGYPSETIKESKNTYKAALATGAPLFRIHKLAFRVKTKVLKEFKALTKRRQNRVQRQKNNFYVKNMSKLTIHALKHSKGEDLIRALNWHIKGDIPERVIANVWGFIKKIGRYEEYGKELKAQIHRGIMNDLTKKQRRIFLTCFPVYAIYLFKEGQLGNFLFRRNNV